MFHTEFERHVIERALLIELGQNLDRLAQVRVLAGMFAQPRNGFGEGYVAGLLGSQMLLNERVEVLVSLLQRAAVILAAEQALDAVGAEPLPQAFRHGLRNALKHFTDAKSLREQSADCVHGALTAAVHADLRLGECAAHGLGLLAMHVAICLNPEPGQFEKRRRFVVFLERFRLRLDAGRFGFELTLRIGDAEHFDFHFCPPASSGFALDAFGADFLRFSRRARTRQGRLRLKLGGRLARLRLSHRVHARHRGLAFFVDPPRLGRLSSHYDLDLAGALGVGNNPHRLDGVLGPLAVRGAGEALGLGDLKLPRLGGKRDLAVALGVLSGEEALDVGPLALAFLVDQRNVAIDLLDLGGERTAYLRLLQFGVLLHQRDPAIAILLFARLLASNFRELQFLGLGDEGDFAVAFLLRAGECPANLRGFARFRFLDDGDFLLDLRSLQRLALADFLLFHFPPPFEHETLLLAQDTRALVGDFFFLFRSRDGLVPVELQNPKPRFEAPSTDGDRGLFADLVALVARAVFRGRDRCGAGDLCLLPLALFRGEIDILFALGALACEIAGDFGDLGFARLVDQGDLTVAAFLFQCELFLHLRYFAPLCLCREGDVALGAQLLKRFFVFDLALFNRQALVEDETSAFRAAAWPARWRCPCPGWRGRPPPGVRFQAVRVVWSGPCCGWRQSFASRWCGPCAALPT